MKEYRGKIILTSVVTVLPIVIGLLLWNRLPDTIATHFTFDNVANGWSSKPFTVLGLPIILTVLHLVAVTVSLNDPKRKILAERCFRLYFGLYRLFRGLCFCLFIQMH